MASTQDNSKSKKQASKEEHEEKREPANKESPEYKAFHSQYSIICDLLVGSQAVILPFATHLYSNDIISHGVHANIQDSRNPPYERVTAVMSAVDALFPNKENVFKEVVLALKKVGMSVAVNGIIKSFGKRERERQR